MSARTAKHGLKRAGKAENEWNSNDSWNMSNKTRTEGAALQYARFLGKKVRIYYQDMRGTNRSLVGTIVDYDNNTLWLENGAWQGCLNCANAKISIVSTVEGWGSHTQEVEYKGNDEDVY